MSWSPESPTSPDRLDALVWAVTELNAHSGVEAYLRHIGVTCPHCDFPNVRTRPVCFHCGKALT